MTRERKRISIPYRFHPRRRFSLERVMLVHSSRAFVIAETPRRVRVHFSPLMGESK